MIKKTIFILLIILAFLLIILNSSHLFSKNKLPAPTSISNLSQTIPTRPNIPPQATPTLSTLFKPLPPDFVLKLQPIKNRLPFKTADFDIGYSYLFDKFIVYKKTPAGEEKLGEFLKNKEVSLEILQKNNLLIFTNQPIESYKNQIENKYVNQILFSFIPSPTISPSSDSLKLLMELLNIFFSLNYNPKITPYPSSPPGISPTTSVNPQTPSPISPSPTLPPTQPFSLALSDIFNEVGQKVGMPPKILEAVMKIETPSTFNLSSQEIANYSTPGGFLPACGPNVCSATGPMQMTIGVDGNGDTACPACGVGFCPNAWLNYGASVNRFGGYSHQPNPCNIRDNVYSSAWKLKSDSGNNDPLNWTREQVYRATTRYYGSCDDKYRYDRLGGRTYCEYVWDYYQNIILP